MDLNKGLISKWKNGDSDLGKLLEHGIQLYY
jgi:hypothetical protein